MSCFYLLTVQIFLTVPLFILLIQNNKTTYRYFLGSFYFGVQGMEPRLGLGSSTDELYSKPLQVFQVTMGTKEEILKIITLGLEKWLRG